MSDILVKLRKARGIKFVVVYVQQVVEVASGCGTREPDASIEFAKANRARVHLHQEQEGRRGIAMKDASRESNRGGYR